ncbi:hypothetical protein KKB69_02120 [Patescibacteria group bacterium]|nr:hypothetical protein [Patescibacteria group bacterium]
MTKTTFLLVDDSEDSEKAIDLLKNSGIEFEVVAFKVDEDIKPPVLFIVEGYVEGINFIRDYITTLMDES